MFYFRGREIDCGPGTEREMNGAMFSVTEGQ